jgi:hypothetical protein
MSCPASPRSGGRAGFGGHTSFMCDGEDDVLVRDAEYGGGGLIGLFIIVFCACACLKGWKHGRHHYHGLRGDGGWPQPSGTSQPYVAYGQPVVQPQYGGYQQPPPLYQQPMYVHQQPPMPTIVVTDAGGHHGFGGGGHHHHHSYVEPPHHHGHHGQGHGHQVHDDGGSFHIEQRHTSTSGGF